jgi:hypothetical protein
MIARRDDSGDSEVPVHGGGPGPGSAASKLKVSGLGRKENEHESAQRETKGVQRDLLDEDGLSN